MKETEDRTIQVLRRLERLCAGRECCSSDIYRKALEKLGGDENAAEEILGKLTEGGFVNDARYAAAFAREKSSITGWGPIKIRYALSAKKIPREAIDAALAGTEEDKAEKRLERLLLNKWKSLEGEPDAKLKLLKFALARGYEYDAVKALAERIASGHSL